MSMTLEEIAQKLHETDKKVQLIYAFNGTGKTRLSRAMKELIAPKVEGDEYQTDEETRQKILYYNAFTEDLFYWDNDLEGDSEPKLKIQPNSFTNWILNDQGDGNIIKKFQHYTDKNLLPVFNPKEEIKVDKNGKNVEVKTYPEVVFNFLSSNPVTVGASEITIDENALVVRPKAENIKISKGEESNFIWSFFFALLEEVVSELNRSELEDRSTDQFNELKYVFIDDPVSSLDENHLIELAVSLASLIKAAPTQLKFVITSHNPLFYNVLHSELGMKTKGKREGCYLLERFEDGSFNLNVKYGDANKSFFYHLHLKRILEEAIANNTIERFHFTLLRNLYEKTAGFLGYYQWSDLLDTVEGSKVAYVRAINTFTHSALSTEQMREPSPAEKNTVKLLLDNLVNNYAYKEQKDQDG